MLKRIIASTILILGAFILPWWFVIPFVFWAILLWCPFYEGMIIGLIIDSLNYTPESTLFFSRFPLTIITALFIVFSVSIKKNLKFWS